MLPQKSRTHLGFDLNQQNADGKLQTRYELTLEERSVLEYARQKGALIVVPAGNDGGVMSALGQAAQEFDNIVTVGALDGNGRAAYSSYGAGLTIMAPGGVTDAPILSTVGDGLGTMAGTSDAAAYAAGYIGNIWAANPQLSYQQVIDIIKATARDINQAGWDAETGFGILDVVAAVELAQQTEPEVYDPPATILPLTVTGGDQLLSLERSANFSTDFTAWVVPTLGANVREKPTTKSRIVGTRAFKSNVRFTSWIYGERVTDVASGEPDERWYYDEQSKGWIASAIVGGNAPGSTPLPPITIIKPPGTIVAINLNAPVYQNGRDNPFAYNWVGQCTWYVYGRMIETGLLPTSAKPNGLFLGNAEAWRRDAQRAGLTINSQPTQARGLVVWPPGVQGGDKRFGHVAFLEELLPDGRIRISESNWERPLTFDQRFLTPAQYAGLAFIPLEGVTANPGVYSPPGTPGATREYRVKKGDTLTAIALRELGNANRWREIQKSDKSTFSDEEARRLQIDSSVYLPVKPPSVTSSDGTNPEKPTEPAPEFVPIPKEKNASQILAFSLRNQSLWGGGYNLFDRDFSYADDILDQEISFFGDHSVKLSYGYNAFVSSGGFDVDFGTSFDVKYPSTAKPGDLIRINLTSSVQNGKGDGTSLKTRIGAGFNAEAAFEYTYQPSGWNAPLYEFKAGSSTNPKDLLQGKSRWWNLLNLGIAADSDNLLNGSITAEDKLDLTIDLFDVIPQLKAPKKIFGEFGVGVGLKLGPIVTQSSEFKVNNFSFEFGDFQARPAYDPNPDDSVTYSYLEIKVPNNLEPGQSYDIELEVNPLANLFTTFGIAGSIQASVGLAPNIPGLGQQEIFKFENTLNTPSWNLPAWQNSNVFRQSKGSYKMKPVSIQIV